MDINEYLETHKDQYNYCETIIYPDGTIEDAHPSHTEKLISIACNQNSLKREELYELLPISAGPAEWLVDYTNCCAIWYGFGMLPENITKQQFDTINKLKEAGQIYHDFKMEQKFELKICQLHDKMADATHEEFEEILHEIETIRNNDTCQMEL